MDCLIDECIFNGQGKCGHSGVVATRSDFLDLTGRWPGPVVGCSEMISVESGGEAGECQDGSCALGGRAVA